MHFSTKIAKSRLHFVHKIIIFVTKLMMCFTPCYKTSRKARTKTERDTSLTAPISDTEPIYIKTYYVLGLKESRGKRKTRCYLINYGEIHINMARAKTKRP